VISHQVALNQARQGILQTIEDNPVELRLSRAPLVDNGAGVMVPDPYGVRTVRESRGRIAPLPYGAQKVAGHEATSAGVGTQDVQFLLGAWDADMQEGDRLGYLDFTWVVGPVVEIYRFGGVVGKQARLQKAEAIEVTT